MSVALLMIVALVSVVLLGVAVTLVIKANQSLRKIAHTASFAPSGFDGTADRRNGY